MFECAHGSVWLGAQLHSHILTTLHLSPACVSVGFLHRWLRRRLFRPSACTEISWWWIWGSCVVPEARWGAMATPHSCAPVGMWSLMFICRYRAFLSACSMLSQGSLVPAAGHLPGASLRYRPVCWCPRACLYSQTSPLPGLFTLHWGRSVLLKKCWYMFLFHASP